MATLNKTGTFIEKNIPVFDRIIETCIYLFILLLFITKGEGVRNTLLFLNFFLWLITLKYRQNKSALYEPVSLVYWGFMVSAIVSAILSIDMWYSIKQLGGDFMKSLLFFPVLSTVFSDEKRLRRLIYAVFFVLIVTVSNGYYSYFAYHLQTMMAESPLRHAYHNRFAMDLNLLLPFSFILLLTARRLLHKLVIIIAIPVTILALVLTVSRAGIIAFVVTVSVWIVYGLRNSRLRLKPLLIGVISAFLILAGAAYYFDPNVKNRLALVSQPEHPISTLNKRTDIWLPTVYAAAHRPVFGWGYGEQIFRMDIPFEKASVKTSPYKIDPELRDAHNTFISTFFNQGIVGLTLYLTLLVISVRVFWKNIDSCNMRSYILLSCASILIGTYFVHSLVEVVKFRYLTLVVGIGLAAKNLNSENSHH